MIKLNFPVVFNQAGKKHPLCTFVDYLNKIRFLNSMSCIQRSIRWYGILFRETIKRMFVFEAPTHF